MYKTLLQTNMQKAIKLAKEAGVDIAAYGCRVTADTIETDGEKICLDL